MKQCTPCDETKFSCYGSDKIGAKEGFWRIDATSDNFIPCP